MLVIADSSPLIVLVQIEHVDVLPKLFGQILVPPDVISELRGPKRAEHIREFFQHCPAWLEERTPAVIELIPELHAGEIAAISLAKELHADLLLMDDKEGRRAAAERGIPFTGTIGVLESAAARGLIVLEDAFEKVKKTDFWISPEFLDARLRLFREQGNKP
jgi:predicted nucleic acid-binding protein